MRTVGALTAADLECHAADFSLLSASTGIDETTVIFEGDAADANFQNTVALDVTHELLRNVLLNANVGYARDDFEGTSRTDNIFSAGTGVSYLLNRNLSLDAQVPFHASAIRTTTTSSSTATSS